MILRQLAKSIGQDFRKDGVTSVLEVRIFISGMLHAAENHIMPVGNLIQRKLAKLNEN